MVQEAMWPPVNPPGQAERTAAAATERGSTYGLLQACGADQAGAIHSQFTEDVAQ
jgi:hypothetical protein